MNKDGLDRREFLAAVAMTAIKVHDFGSAGNMSRDSKENKQATVFRSIGSSPSKNLGKTLELIGGVEQLVDQDAIVLIKPNVQWWNQGAPNMEALEALVDLIIGRPGGYRGEVVIGENCHRGPRPWESSGWSGRFERNGGKGKTNTMLEVCDKLRARYGNSFSVRHWIDVDAGGSRVFRPSDGEGYVYCDGTGGVPLITCDNGATDRGEGIRRSRRTIMTYPIFRTDRGTMVDFKNGIWEKGSYTGRPFHFFNLAALNHHSSYCGMTSAVKNHYGVVDLSGGADPVAGGRFSGDNYNFHAFAFNEWEKGPVPGAMGKAVGTFLATIRKPDLNIVTADWIGLASRTELPAARTKAILASTDPVALDYHSAKYLLFPNSSISFHDPDKIKGPIRRDLEECARVMGGVVDEGKVEVVSWDHNTGRFQKNGDLTVRGDIRWGSDSKTLMKYAFYRIFG